MNNEELENSLRTEVDNYFKSAFADVRQEVEQLHDSLNSEFERHRQEVEEKFRGLLERDIQEVKIEDSFASVVAEHLRIAREEGSNSLAEALAQAQDELEAQKEVARQAQEEAEALRAAAAQKTDVDYTSLRDAVNDISNQPSQAEILKALVRHAGDFAPRGALFIVKSDHLIGWKVFGEEASSAEDSVREVFLPVNNNSILSSSITNQNIEAHAGSANAEDRQFLNKLGFGEPRNAVAIPLIVRGRGVAALYADSGAEEKTVQTEALEALVRVAGLTVELLAAAKAPAHRPLSSFSEHSRTQPVSEPQRTTVPAPAVETAPSVKYNGNYNYQAPTVETAAEVEEAQVVTDESADYEQRFEQPYETYSFAPAPSIAPSVNEDPPLPPIEQPIPSEPVFEQPAARNDFFPTTQPEPSPQPQQRETYEAPGAARRFGERNLELPINVPEEERRLHNDARRFARLLVSEIKLYNEQKVREGRQSRDLYERLREAIDRSREMYDKRVSPAVAGKFDYFHYELVNTLAEGDESRLGADYPGSTV